jgi:acetyl esterase/lipase
LALMDARYLSALDHSSDEVCGWIGLSGVHDIQAEASFWLAQNDEAKTMTEVMGGQENFVEASPITYVRADLPPSLLIHGDEDETVPVAITLEMHAALQAAGVESELKVYSGMGHTDYLFSALTQDGAEIVDDLVAFVLGCRP